MTPLQQKLFNDFKSHKDFITVEFLPVPKILADQIEETDIVMYRCVMTRHGKPVDIDVVLTNDYINNMDFDNVSYGKLMADELVYCEHPDVTITGCIHSIHENKGKPAYFIRPSDSFGVRLTSEYPAPLPESDALKTLIERIKQIPDVAKVTVDRIVSQELKDMVNCPDNEGLIFYVEDETAHDWRIGNYEENKTNCYWFVYPKSIWSNDVTFDKAIEAIEESFIAHRTGKPYPGKK
jgi:hypothetical protein